ncbi:uncharacterized protein [Watersipora subatra]|uniref:uncharacterized protein n=1 Tax=Watersipora subatra TaxID=2589382 RepID=UPI00355BDAD1
MVDLGVKFLIVLITAENIFRIDGTEEEVNGGWKLASLDDSMRFYTNVCTIPKISIQEMTKERFETSFRDKPFILTFPNGADDWVKSEHWTVQSLSREYQEWKFTAGKSIDIVYNGGKGDFKRTFKEYVAEMRNTTIQSGDFTYLFDRNFYYNSSLPSTVRVPEFLFEEGDPILFVGPSGTGATWHKHMPAWNGVVFGQKRWFLYPIEKTPPGGLYAYTPTAWLAHVYPKLEPYAKPLECIQNSGEIFYVPESYYHAILNIGETVAISLQSKNITTNTESEFYSAMADHYEASTNDDLNKVEAFYNAAVRKYMDLHFLYPENTEVLAHISEIACDRGYQRRCERVLDLIIQLDPFAVESIKLRSRIYYDTQKYELCEQEVLRALAIHPQSKTLLREHANFLWNVRKTESKEAYKKLLGVLDPVTDEAEQVREILRITDFGPELSSPSEIDADEESRIAILEDLDTDHDMEIPPTTTTFPGIKEEL